MVQHAAMSRILDQIREALAAFAGGKADPALIERKIGGP